MEKNKNLEYYLDAKISGEEMQKSIEQTKKQFSNKKIEVRIALNQFGMYIITFKFQDKNTFFNKIFKKARKENLV